MKVVNLLQIGVGLGNIFSLISLLSSIVPRIGEAIMSR